MKDLDLSGEWRAIDGQSSASAFHAVDFDDSTWPRVGVPSHWVSVPELAASAGTVFYRKRFESFPETGRRSWLQFDGVFSHASVWIDGSYVGEIDGYFAPHSFDVTSALNSRAEHVVAVEVNAPSFDIPWSSPGGIWQPVGLKHSGAVRVARARVLCSEAREERGVLSCYAELDATESCEIRIRTLITANQSNHAGSDNEITRHLAVGANRLSWHVTIDQPELWWPWHLGNTAFFNVELEVIDTRLPHQISDQTKMRTAFRQVSFDNGYTFVNGERLFLQSIESGNDGTPPLETDRAYFEQLIGNSRDSGANLLVRADWIEPQPFYDIADELGMLVWQGIPGNANIERGARNARQTVEVLGSHPSIALWLRPPKRLRDRRPTPDTIKRAFDKSDTTRSNIEQPLGWDLNHFDARDVLAIVPKWTKRSHFLWFSSDPREAATHIDALRLLKYRPLGGFVAPLALPELLDGACSPVRLIALPKEPLDPHDETEVDIFILNDSREAINDVVVSAVVADQEWKWSGGVDADDISYIGTIPATPTSSALDITLRLDGADLADAHASERVVHIPVKRSRT